MAGNNHNYFWRSAIWVLVWVSAPGMVSAGDPIISNDSCLECHDDIPDVLYKTVHNPVFEVACEDCHQTEATHLEDPEVDNTDVPLGVGGQEVCLKCHESRPSFSRHGAHAQADVGCSDCHQAHATARAPSPLLTRTGASLCLACHQDLKTSVSKPYAHKAGKGEADCVACHDPHSAKSDFRGSLDVEEICVSCHVEQRGPFVFEHVSGVTGTCLSCHELHGSNHPKQLTRAVVSSLCLECHSALPVGTLGSQPPAFHDLRSPRYQNCTVCHTAVHGSHTSPGLLK